MLQCEIDFLKLIKPILINSGRGFQHKGHYQTCLENQQMKYAVIELGLSGQATGIYVTGCLPRHCSDKFIAGQIDALLKAIKMPLEVFFIKSDTQHYVFELSWVSYLTIFLLLSIAIIVFTATVRGFRRKHQNNKWIQCFNLTTNIKYFDIRKGETLNAWDGVRALAMMWVVIGHVYSNFLAGIINLGNIQHLLNHPFVLIIISGIFSVDVFLALGGFFLAFIMLRNKVTVQLCLMGIAQRVLRIWPAFILTMIFYYSLMGRFGSGQFWDKITMDSGTCKSMWREVLFISNFVDNGKYACLGWSWYLQVDLQMFMVSAFILLIYSKHKMAYYIVCYALILGSTILNYIVSYNQEVKIVTNLPAIIAFQPFTYDLYIKPYGRCTPYLMGLVFGTLYMEYREQLKKKGQNITFLARVREYLRQRRIVKVVIEWLGIVMMLFILLIPRPLQLGHQWAQYLHSLYYSLYKPIFIIGLYLTLLPSSLGLPSFFTTLLTNSILTFVARISFCTYLVHLIIIYSFILQRTYDVYFNLIDVFVMYFGLLVVSLFFGLVATLTVELPFANLLKISMAQLKKSKQNEMSIYSGSPKLNQQSLISTESQQLKGTTN